MTVAPEIVEKALKLVFGESSQQAKLDDLNSLDERALKSAFRKKAMHFHPDRAEVLELDVHVLERLFKRLHGAYRLLNRVLVDESLHVNTAVHRRADRPMQTEPAGRYFTGRTPQGKLRFAQFLYYNGHIDWQSMIDAITWQLIVRPKIGDIGRAYGFFDHSGILSVIRKRERTELFGGAALRMGMVSRLQLNTMLGKQKNLNCPIGRYFLERGMFSQYEIETLLARSREHNRRYT